MAILRLPDENQSIRDHEHIEAYLSDFGIEYDRWDPDRNIGASASPQEVLEAYAPEIEALKAKGDYTTADVIDVNPETPQLDAMLPNSRSSTGTMKTRYASSSRTGACFISDPRTVQSWH